MENNTLYASNLTYEFEKVRIYGSENALEAVKNEVKNSYPEKLEYLDDFYDKDTGSSGTAFKDKDTGEVILAYTGTNFKSDLWNDAVKTDFGRIALGLGDDHVDPARKFYEKIRAEYGDDIILTGHSLGGNLAQWIALYYNVQKTIIYNPAPLYIPPEQLIATLGAWSIKDAVAIPLGFIKDGAKWLFGIKTGEDKIKNLKETFTGWVIRIQSELDIVNNPSDYLRGEYLGVEHILKDAGWHSLGDILKSEELKEELERITRQLYKIKANIDIDGDGKIDVKLGELDLKRRNLLNDKASIASGGKIQLNPEVLKTLSNNIQMRVLGDLEKVKEITKLCIEKNNKVRMDFNQRKEQVTESIQEELNNTGIPVILDNLRESVGEIIKNKHLLEALQQKYQLKMEQFGSNEIPLVSGTVSTKTDIARQGIATINSFKSNIAEAFKGQGVRSKFDDGIAKPLGEVIKVEKTNMDAMEKCIRSMQQSVIALADSHQANDTTIEQNWNTKQDVLGNYKVGEIPSDFNTFVEKSGLFDDLAVLKAFDKQVDDEANSLSSKMATSFTAYLTVAKDKSRNTYADLKDTQMSAASVISDFPTGIYYKEEKEEGEYDIHYYRTIEESIEVAATIKETENLITELEKSYRDTIQTIDSAGGLLSTLKTELRNYLEDAIYNYSTLSEVVRAQRLIMLVMNKINAQVTSFSELVNQNKGKSIEALDGRMKELGVMTSHISELMSTCFGDK